MDFTLCPEGGPPRLVRFTALPVGVIARLDSTTNVLEIDGDRYELLGEDDKNKVLRTRQSELRLGSDEENYIHYTIAA